MSNLIFFTGNVSDKREMLQNAAQSGIIRRWLSGTCVTMWCR